MRMTPEQLKFELSSSIGEGLAEQLVTSYTAMHQRFFAGDWRPAELDGGQFCEAAARALWYYDSGILSTNLPNRVCDQLLDRGSSGTPHKLPAKERDHFCRVLQTTYKFRNDRGVAHISSTHSANHIDAALVMACVKWLFAEILRLTWNGERTQVAQVIESIAELDHPLVYELDGKPLVLSNALTASEEILLLLYRAAGCRLTRDELKAFVRKTPAAINTAIARLCQSREVCLGEHKEIAITPLGERRVRMEILTRLTDRHGPPPAGKPGTSPSKKRSARQPRHARGGVKAGGA